MPPTCRRRPSELAVHVALYPHERFLRGFEQFVTLLYHILTQRGCGAHRILATSHLELLDLTDTPYWDAVVFTAAQGSARLGL